jgi:hypothetical protein
MVDIVSAQSDSATGDVRLRRATAVAGLLSVGSMVAAVLVANPQDVGNQAALQTYLQRNGDHLAIAWLIGAVGGLAWLVFVIGLRRLLTAGAGRDLFVVAAVCAQAMAWTGASIGTANAPPEAREVPLAVFNAFREAGHLAGAAGTAAVGLSLLGLAMATSRTTGWSPLFVRVTSALGVLLVLAAVIGPVTVPVLVLWELGTCILLLRTRNRTPAGAPAPA